MHLCSQSKLPAIRFEVRMFLSVVVRQEGLGREKWSIRALTLRCLTAVTSPPRTINHPLKHFKFCFDFLIRTLSIQPPNTKSNIKTTGQSKSATSGNRSFQDGSPQPSSSEHLLSNLNFLRTKDPLSPLSWQYQYDATAQSRPEENGRYFETQSCFENRYRGHDGVGGAECCYG